VTGQIGVSPSRPRMMKPIRPEIGNWKLNVAKNQGSGVGVLDRQPTKGSTRSR
jgi:hypothetical protein